MATDDKIFLKSLKRWCREAEKSAEPARQSREMALALFEISDLNPGRHEKICRKIVRKFGGVVVGPTERGLFCRFDKPIDACLAALNIKKGSSLLGLPARVGLAWGGVDGTNPKGPYRTRGDAVRRSLRMAVLALPGQILIDSSLKTSIEADLAAFPDVLISHPVAVDLKEVGRTEVMEFTTKEFGFSAPTEEHVPVIGDVEVSPVRYASYPEETDPGKYLICDTCQKTLAPDGSDGMLVIDREGDVVRRFQLFHKGNCDTVKTHAWRDLTEFTNPECYIQLVIALLNNWALKKLVVEDAAGLVRLLMGMYRKVYRPTTNKEHLNFIGVMHLMRLIGE